MSNRIEKLLGSIQVERYPICIEKARLITESYKQTEGEPSVVRRAKAIANILDKIPVFIEDGELIVGNVASKPMGVEIDPDVGIWSYKEIQYLKEEGYTISEDDEAYIISMNEYWKTKTLYAGCGRVFDEERLWPFVQTGIVLPPWKDRVEGYGGGYAQGGMGLGPGFLMFGLDFAKVLSRGLDHVIQEAQEELRNIRFTNADSIKKADFLKSVIVVLNAIDHFAHRFSVVATGMRIEEADPIRKRELERIAEICKQVPAKSARTFYEAIQSFWFIFVMISPSSTVAAGRFDQYMYPYYKKDKNKGRITDAEVLELLQCLRIKDMQINHTPGKSSREKHAGMAKWHNWTIGGVTPEGKDATNELTYLILEAAKRCPTPHHTITLRVHDETPEKLMLKALEVVKTGIGMPAFVGDKSYIEYLLIQGVPLKVARDYLMTGCIDCNITGQSRIMSYGMFIVPLVFDIFMHNGVDQNTSNQVGLKTGELESFETFDALMKAFKKQLAHFMSLSVEYSNIRMRVGAELFPYPLHSSLMVDAIKEGKDILDRTFPLENAAVLNTIGMINVADSLAAIKKLVFDEKKVTMKELKAALAANWNGNGYEEMHKMFLEAPKFGNDEDYVDSIARDLYQFWADTAVTFDTIFGGKIKPTGISISTQWPGGALTSATPDGRYSGECLADGTMSPMRGRDTHGPTAVIKSASKIDQVPYQATLLNMKFHPSALKSTEDMRKLSDLIRVYFSLGGKHIQFNIVDKTTLLDAQKHPENHRDLIVRVAGYSAYFVQLGKVIQDEIIGRMEHELI